MESPVQFGYNPSSIGRDPASLSGIKMSHISPNEEFSSAYASGPSDVKGHQRATYLPRFNASQADG
jgi:hypothetical protein